MNDKREIANQELKNEFDSNLFYLNKNDSSNFVELSAPEATDELSGTSTTNNYNVNVNINGTSESKTSNPTQNARTIVNNVLRSDTIATSDELKKNSNPLFAKTGEDNHNIPKLLDKDSESKMEILHKAIDRGSPAPSLDMRRLDFVTADTPSEYNYSESPLKARDTTIQKNLGILHDISANSIHNYTNMTVLPNSAVQNSFAKDEMESTIDFFEASTVRVDSQPTNRYDQLDKVIQESEKRDINRAKEKEETLHEMADDKKKKVNMGAEMEDMKDANAPTQAEMLSGANKQPDSGPRDFINMTTRSNTIGSFVEKMNSPPIWRTVLG